MRTQVTLRLVMPPEGDDPNQLSPSLTRGLSDTGCELHTLVFDAPTATRWHRAMQRYFPGRAFSEINAKLLAMIDAIHPDVLWLFKGMEIYPETLRKIRANGVTLVNYNADHPFSYFARGSGNSNVLRSIPEFHLHLTYSEYIAREMRARYPDVRIAVVPFGHNVGEDTYRQICGEEETLRACFVGYPDEYRLSNIKRLTEAGLPVDVYGNRWDRYLKSTPLLRVHGPVFGEEMLRTLRRYRLQLNFFRPHNVESHNMRTFEVPACGGIMLAEDSIEHRAFFENGREAFFFSSPQEMTEGARMLLAMPKQEADAVREAARLRSIRSGYTYRDRAHAALAEISAVHAARVHAGGQPADNGKRSLRGWK